jgi:hypothetical protein
LQTQTKQAHWDVKGPNFIALHELFDGINEEVEDYVDDIAERSVQLGGVAEGAARMVVNRSTLRDQVMRSLVRHADCNLALAVACFGLIDRLHPAPANRRRQHGHSPSRPWIRAENAAGCGRVMIALNASGGAVGVVTAGDAAGRVAEDLDRRLRDVLVVVRHGRPSAPRTRLHLSRRSSSAWRRRVRRAAGSGRSAAPHRRHDGRPRHGQALRHRPALIHDVTRAR